MFEAIGEARHGLDYLTALDRPALAPSACSSVNRIVPPWEPPVLEILSYVPELCHASLPSGVTAGQLRWFRAALIGPIDFSSLCQFLILLYFGIIESILQFVPFPFYSTINMVNTHFTIQP